MPPLADLEVFSNVPVQQKKIIEFCFICGQFKPSSLCYCSQRCDKNTYCSEGPILFDCSVFRLLLLSSMARNSGLAVPSAGHYCVDLKCILRTFLYIVAYQSFHLVAAFDYFSYIFSFIFTVILTITCVLQNTSSSPSHRARCSVVLRS